MAGCKSSLVLLFAALALVPLMPSADSLWVDEAQTWRYSRHTSLNAAWHEFQGERFSEAQMPLGMAAAWFWAQLFGTSEFALRAPNMLYAIGAILCFYIIGRKEDLPSLPLFLAVQPYLWFYVNEARPYALQIFGGSLLLLALHLVYRGNLSSVRWIVAWGAGALICSAGSMLGAIPTLAFTATILWELVRRNYLPSKGQLAIFAGTTLSLLGLGAYYLQTLLAGSGGAKIWTVGLQNVLFSIIEFFGFAGILPSRQELREMARAGLSYPGEFFSLWTFALPTLGMVLLLVVLGLFWLRNIRQTPRWIMACFAVTAGSAALLFAASIVVGFPFWGRHLAPVFPAFVAALGWVIAMAWRGSGLLTKAAAAILLILLLISSLMLRFSERHAKDDYRTAASFAHETLAQGGTVWWAADPAGANYYGLEPADRNALATKTEPSVLLASNVTAVQASDLPYPSLVVLSKTDIYDSRGDLHAWLNENKYALIHTAKAFWLFEPDTLDER